MFPKKNYFSFYYFYFILLQVLQSMEVSFFLKKSHVTCVINIFW